MIHLILTISCNFFLLLGDDQKSITDLDIIVIIASLSFVVVILFVNKLCKNRSENLLEEAKHDTNDQYHQLNKGSRESGAPPAH